MYCKACGKELDGSAAICMGCGVPVGKGSDFCPACGQSVVKEAVICVHCGATLTEPKKEVPKDARSRVIAAILGILFGALGVHNFYLKRKARAIIQLILSATFALVYIAAIVSVILASLLMEPWTFEGFAIFAALFRLCGLGALGSGIWAFVEAILLLCGAVKTDGRGVAFRD